MPFSVAFNMLRTKVIWRRILVDSRIFQVASYEARVEVCSSREHSTTLPEMG